MTTVRVTPAHLENMAQTHLDTVITFTSEAAYMDLGGVTYVAVLPSVAEVSA